MSKFEQFSENFIAELLKLCFYKKDICEIVCQHLSYEYIPVELKGYKQILKSIINHFNSTQTLPSIGVIAQSNYNVEVFEAIERINQANLSDRDIILVSLESYIKRVRFQQMYMKTGDMYNNGQQQEAIDYISKESSDITNFSIFKDTSSVEDIFNGFFKRDEYRFTQSQTITNKSKKVPFGVDLLDAITFGGSEPGETDCFLGRSGSGKTKWLRWRGISAARRGYRVLHIQAEGTKEECTLGYDATWTAILKKDLKVGNIPAEYQNQLEKIIRDIKIKGGGIEVIAYEQFESATMKDVRNNVIDYYKRHGYYPDLIILDYLELFHPGSNQRYSATAEGQKYKREDSARALKNICNEFKLRGATAAQANDISPTDFNRTDWVMTRHNIAGAKGFVDSFSYFFTFNVSSDEYKKKIARLYVDKMREYQSGQTIRICTDYTRDRFYDRPNTLKMWPEDYESK